MRFSYDYQGESQHVELVRLPDGSLQATIDETVYAVHATKMPDGAWLLRIDGQRVLAHVARDAEERYVHADGQQYTLEKADAQRRKRGAAATSGEIVAEMPGQVIDVRVEVDAHVEAGAVLVVLEAMKMEIRATAPADGIISAVHVNIGDVVERGQRLVDLKAD